MMSRKSLLAGGALSTLLAIPAVAQTVPQQTGSAGGLNYITMTSPDGCSSANPCQIIEYLHYLGGANQTNGDVNTFFNNAKFWSAHPHTILIAPLLPDSSSTNNWGGVSPGLSAGGQGAIDVVRHIEATVPTDPNTVVLTGGSMGGLGTESLMSLAGPKGSTGQHIYAAGLGYDGADYVLSASEAKATLCGVPLTLQHGSADQTVNSAPDNALAATLSGCPGFNYVVKQGSGHGTWNSGYAAGTQLDQIAAAAAGNPVSGGTPSAPLAPTTSNATNTPAAPTLSATAATSDAKTITPGSGSITDKDGHRWTISQNGSIKEDDQWVAGGGGTSALTILDDGSIYGEDDSGKGWFTFSTSGQVWANSQPPPSGSIVTTSTTPKPSAVAASGGACVKIDGAFGILPTASGGVGQIYDPNQKPWHGHGINVMSFDQLGTVDSVKSLFPGLNFIRMPEYDPDLDPATLADMVNSYTSAGIVVEFEDHWTSDGSNAGGSQGSVFTGDFLNREQAFFARFAAYFKDNPYVWWGTNNEPPNGGGALSAWQLQTYNTIRATGNKAPILLEMLGWADPGSFGPGYDASAYSQMSNVIWDMHYYGWLTHYSTDQGENNAFIAAAVKQAQKFTSAGGLIMPIIIGEYGNSTTGMTIDANGKQAVEAVQQASMSGVVAGTAAWAYGPGNPGDGLTNGGGGLSDYGQQVESYIVQADAMVPTAPGSSCSDTDVASAPAASATKIAAITTPAPLQPTPEQGAAQAAVKQAQIDMDQVDTATTDASPDIQQAVDQTNQSIANLQALIQQGRGQ